MVVDDTSLRETDQIVLLSRTFYPAQIPVLHWQLRNLISSPESDVIYYFSKAHLFCLDVAKNTRTLVETFPYEIKCSASGYGWVCAGGSGERDRHEREQNQVFILKLDSVSAQEVEVDDPPSISGVRSRSSPHTPSYQTVQLGDDIINSVSIHKLDGDEGEGTKDDYVVVVTCNDKHVRVYSLMEEDTTAEMSLHFPVNHATISPDGRLLVAVGDFQHAYFYERLPKESKSNAGKYASRASDWELLHIIPLYAPKSGIVSGYFSTAWSPSGSYCAVASELGYITVFDMDVLKDADNAEDAIMHIIPSSRPEAPRAGPGAVRAMRFTPPPWDLLIWMEDQGRVCVGDLRTGLRSKQIITLDANAEGVRRIDPTEIGARPEPCTTRRSTPQDDELILDQAADDLLIRSLRGVPGPPIESQVPTPPDLRDQLRNLNRLRNRNSERRSSPESRWNLGRGPRSIHYASGGEMAPPERVSQSPPYLDFPPLTRTNPGALAEDTHVHLFLHPGQAWARQQNLAHSRAAPHSPMSRPRRQDSIVITNVHHGNRSSSTLNGSSSSSPSGMTPSSSNSSANNSRHPPLPPHHHHHYLLHGGSNGLGSSDSSPAYNHGLTFMDQLHPHRRRQSPPPPGELSREFSERRRRQQMSRARQERQQRSSRMLEANRLTPEQINLMSRSSRLWNGPDPNGGPRTVGLIVSEDGSRFWVGIEDGIFELEINLKERRCFPAIEFR